MIKWIRSEPVAISGALQAIIALVLAFGVHLTDAQVTAIMGVAATELALVVRNNVTPVNRGS